MLINFAQLFIRLSYTSDHTHIPEEQNLGRLKRYLHSFSNLDTGANFG
jgi:hypothetical protein